MRPARTLVALVASGVMFLFTALPAHAGMTVYGLNDFYRLRVQDISFLVFLLLLCALILKLVWNYAFKGFTAIPRIKYFQALALAILFGLVMLLILTMISGIREVLTPGAWRHQGTSYKLNAPTQEPMRLRSLEHLRAALMSYAQVHDGKFPANDFSDEINEKLWESPEENGSHYIYRGGLTLADTNALMAVEPVMFGEKRFGLFVSGQIKLLTNSEIETSLSGDSHP